jgi:hypothetical protein
MGRLHLAASRRIARNENGIPFDPEKPAIAFGVRLVARIWRRPVQKSRRALEARQRMANRRP